MSDAEIQIVVHELASAWNRADAAAFAKRFGRAGTFTNINGTTFEGHDAFEQRHREIFAGSAKGSSVTLTIRRCQFVRPDVAVVDVDGSLKVPAAPLLETRLLLVLTKERGEWSIVAFHNTPVPSAPIVR